MSRKDKQATLDYNREWRKRNPNKWASYQRTYRRNHPDAGHSAYIKCEYGLAKTEYDELLVQQNGVCAICHKPESAIRKGKLLRLAVDHDHETEEVRGLLCRNCNIVLGLVEDDIELLASAMDYLTKEKMNGGNGD